MSLKKNQQGFSPVEILIVLVIVGLIGTVGWLVYNRQSGKTAVDTSQSKSTPIQNQPSQTTQNNEDEQRYLLIKEWGVKLPLNSDVGDLSYSISANTVRIRSTELDKLSGTCTNNSINIVRGKATEMVPAHTDEPTETFEAVYNTKSQEVPSSTTLAKKIGEYYFLSSNAARASCIDIPYEEPEGKAKQEAEAKAELDIVKTINQLVQQ